jgi:hypothetical protein
MNQIIIIGEVKKVEKDDKYLLVTMKTKDYEKKTCSVSIIVENGYKEEMVTILEKNPLIAVKCGLKVSSKKIEFIAEKMSVLKLSEEEKES